MIVKEQAEIINTIAETCEAFVQESNRVENTAAVGHASSDELEEILKLAALTLQQLRGAKLSVDALLARVRRLNNDVTPKA
jgi:hypothetical protein